MSIWKSPILYLGLLLLALVIGALAAPFIVDWNAYRGSLEAYGSKIAGRKVSVAGPIAVRLFPWPRLEAEDVRVANPIGFGAEPMAKAGKMTINLALAGLMSGKIKVESIALEKPVLSLQLDAQGTGNWHFKPDAGLSQSGLLNDVQLDEISIADGLVILTDARHGWARQVTKVNGQVSGAALEGPWKMRAHGALTPFGKSELPLDFSLATNLPKAGEPPSFVFKFSPLDGSLPSLSFDGKGEAGNFEGRLALDPVVLTDGRSNPSGLLKPLAYTAKLSMKGEQVDLNAIHIVSADTKEAGALIEGDGHIDLAQGVKAQVNLTSPHIDLDAMAGEGMLRLSESGGLMGLVNGLMQQFPESLDLNAKFDVAALTFGGENIQNIVLKSSASAGAVRVQDLTADLPGLSKMKFGGIVFPGNNSAELGGTLAFETGDARAFANWLWPQTKDTIAKIWTGQRGRLKAQGDVSWSGRQFGMQNVNYELDGLSGKGSLAVSLGATPALDLILAADDFDLGAYVPTGISPSGLLSAAPVLLPGDSGFQKKLDLQFGRLSLNGVAANHVVAKIDASSSGFEIKQLDIGSVEGAELRGSGLVVVGGDGPSGEVKFAVGAQHPQGLMRLLGMFPKGPDPVWAQGFGQTNLLADFTVKPGKTEPQINGSLSGNSGPLKLVGTGTVSDLLAKDGPNLGLSGTASSADARDIMRLLGFVPFGAEAGDGQVTFTLQGKAALGLRSVVDFEGLGASGYFDGKLDPNAPLYGLSGNAKLTAEKASALLGALGSPIVSAAPLAAQAELSATADGLQAKSLTLDLAGQKLSGAAQLSAAHHLKLDLTGGTWRSGDLAALALAPWNGLGSFPSGRFAASWPLGLSGDLTLKPAVLIDPLGVALAGTALQFIADATGRSFAVNGPSGLQFDAKLQQKGAAFGAEGSIAYPFTLDKAYAFAAKPSALSGAALLKGKFAGEGYSPLALLRGLSGKGALSVNGLTANNLAPDPFYAAANAAQSAEELNKAFAGLSKGAGVGFAPQDLTCDLKDGALTCGSAKAETQEASVAFTPSADVAEGTVAGEVVLNTKSQTTLPPLRLLLSGQPGAVGERLDSTALSAKLGTALINKDMEELARLQKEQQKADAEAAKQAEDDKTKYDLFQAQRTELRLQARMVKVFQQQRAIDAGRLKAALDAAVAYGQSIAKEEKRRLLQMVPIK